MNDFTVAIYQSLVSDPDTRGTVREWLRSERDPEKRAIDFACQLAQDFRALASTTTDMLNRELLLHALKRVCWRKIADRLLARFGPRWPAALPLPSAN